MLLLPAIMVSKDAQPPVEGRNVSDRVHDISTILGAHGVDKPESYLPYWRNSGDVSQIRAFFADAEDYTPDSRFGQFVQIVVAERRMQHDLTIAARRLAGRGREPSTKEKGEIAERRERCATIRTVRVTIGEGIFGEEHEAYAVRIADTLLKTSGNTQPERERRAQARRSLVAEVKARFPLTSK